MTWADRLAERRHAVATGPGDSLPKLPKSPFVGFVGTPEGTSEKIEAAARTRLHRLAAAEGLPAALVDLRAVVLHEYVAADDDTLRACLRAWARERPGTCDRCGPVLLPPPWPEPTVCCPWCFRKKAGKAIPQPGGHQTVDRGYK